VALACIALSFLSILVSLVKGLALFRVAG